MVSTTLETLPAMDVAGRLRRLRARFVGAGIDALLVTRLPNVRYLTGFTGSAGMVLVTATDALLVTDGRYRDQSAEQIAGSRRRRTRRGRHDPGRQQRDPASRPPRRASRRLGLEAHGRQLGPAARVRRDWFPEAELVATEHLVEDLRMVKDPGEVARVRAACAIADDALADVAADAARRRRPSGTSRSGSEFAMRERGASGVSFDAIVASGPNGAKPHARPSDRTIAPDELVVIDFGCIVDGYCSDMTRTVSVGDPGPDARQLWDTVLLAQQAGSRRGGGRRRVRGGRPRLSRTSSTTPGWGDAFLHGTGPRRRPRDPRGPAGRRDVRVVPSLPATW